MSNPMQPIEVKAATLEEAIENGLAQLGLNRNEVIIEIVEEGSRGMLGIGAREAVARLTPLRAPSSVPAAAPAAPAPAAATRPPKSLDVDEAPERPATDEELDEEATVGQEVLADLLKHMGLRSAKISLERSPDSGSPDGGETGDSPWTLDIRGPNLGTLIGRRGETLEAIQYMTRMIVNHRLQRRTTLVVDVEGYKTRRAETLRNLAKRMATQAKQLGRTVSLEPMPANERRIIHIALQDDQAVRTESVGDGERRKVTIVPTAESKP